MEQNVLIKPEGLRQEQDRLLEMAYRQTVSVYLGEDEQAPEILISEDYKGSPSIFCKKCYGKDKKGYRHRKYEVETIIMDPKDYQKDHFYKTFLKYATGRFRAYGMDRSNTMTVLLSYLGGWMYENRECLETIRRQWEEYADED